MTTDQSPPDAKPTLILASGSPRRRALLNGAGYRFAVVAPDVDETVYPGESGRAMVERLAIDKVRAVAASAGASAGVLACDTTVVLEGEILGKPTDEGDAVATLLRLAGRDHEVLTGWALRPPRGAAMVQGVTLSTVTIRPIDRTEALAYVATGEPLDKAGSYAIQGEGGRFVAQVVGSRSNVAGLPLEDVVPALRSAGLHGAP